MIRNAKLILITRWRKSIPAAALLLSLLACENPAPRTEVSSTESSPHPVNAALELVASGLNNPLYLTSPPGDPRLFIVEQRGTVRIVQNGELLPDPFLDLRDRLRSGGERGLLSLAFHPNYSQNGYCFVNFTDKQGDTRVERFSIGPDPDKAEPSSAKLVLTVDQPYGNHNGGLVLFGPDGMLYIGMGDGGSAGDPHANAQDKTSLLGDLLRIDVDHGDPYSIPPDNPYVDDSKFRPEIWASGLRNPWRFCFDRKANLIYIADVGQNNWEEVHVASADKAGLNYGWNILEGTHCYKSRFCDKTNLELPVLEYSHKEGCCVTGGFVYRGNAIPELSGHYFYGDYCLGWIRSFQYRNDRVTDERNWDFGVAGNILSFGEDSSGELYVLYSNGNVYRMIPAPES